MPKGAAKSRQTQPKARDLYTPAPVRGRVLALHMGGQSNRQIASHEGIDRETVRRILSQQEVSQMMAEYQSRLLTMVPKAIAVFEQALDSDDERVRLAAATKLMEGLRVLRNGGTEQTIGITNRVSPELEQNERRRLLAGDLTLMAVQKSRRFDLPLPPELERLAATIDEV